MSKKLKEGKIDDSECRRHSCDYKGKLKKCKHCGKLFCNEHLNAYKPFAGIDQSEDKHEGNGGHPCPAYVKYAEDKKRKDEERYEKALAELLKKKPEKTIIIQPAKIARKKFNKKNESRPEKVKLVSEKDKETKKILPFRKIFVFMGIIAVLILIFFNWPKINSFFNHSGIEEENLMVLDNKTIQSFEYVNSFRNKYNKTNLTYSLELYDIMKEAVTANEINPKSMDTSTEFQTILKERINISEISRFYYTIYFVGGGGVNSFREEFDKSASKSIIRKDEYNKGAIYCGLDYCALFVFYLEGELNKINSTLLVDKDSLEVEKDNVSKLTKESKYEINPKHVNLRGIGKFTVYEGLNDYLAEQERSISYYYVEPTTKDFILKSLDNKVQKPYLDELVNRIQNKSPSMDEQAEIAIKMVQEIPYDWESFESNDIAARYPYEVLYDMKGVCMEKSDLLAYLLRELGFGTAIFEFEKESHRAVGIKCEKGNYNTNYCFIESTDYYPIGRIPSDYVGGADIRNANPELVIISEGKTFGG